MWRSPSRLPAVEGEAGSGGEAGPKKRSRPQRRKKRTGATAAAEEGAEEAPAAAPAANDAAAPAVPATDGNGEDAPAEAVGKKRSRRPAKGKKPFMDIWEIGQPAERPPPKKRGPPQGEPSKTMLFVANLPFGLDDSGLKAVFEDYKAVSAHVVKRRFGPAEGRSKGFGFVELESEEQQKKALEGVQGKEVEGRALQVKVAVEAEETAA